MQLGENFLKDHVPGEVRILRQPAPHRPGHLRTRIGQPAPLPYGVECIETMDANGGWIASAVDLVRFAAALDDPKGCPMLSAESIRTQLAPPPGPWATDPRGGRRRLTTPVAGRSGRPPGNRQVHQVALRLAGRHLHALGLPRRRHRLGGPVQLRCRQGRQGVRRADRSAASQAGQ